MPPQAGRSTQYCALSRWRLILPSCPDNVTSLHLFRLSEEHAKIKNRCRYTRKVKSDQNTSKDDLDLLGDDEESFSGTQADLEGAADTLFSSPPRPQPLRFESLSLKTPETVPPTPGTALQNKIENNLQKSLGSNLQYPTKARDGCIPGIYV